MGKKDGIAQSQLRADDFLAEMAIQLHFSTSEESSAGSGMFVFGWDCGVQTVTGKKGSLFVKDIVGQQWLKVILIANEGCRCGSREKGDGLVCCWYGG